MTVFDGRSGPKIGLFADCTDESMPILDLAQALTERGFTGLFLNEHPHMPVEHPRSEFPAGGPIPGRYARFWCPFTALSFVAAQTDLDVGTCISLVGEHDAIALAKSIATLDVLSEGRFVLGVGFGWHREEFEDHGHPAKVRARVVEETAKAIVRAHDHGAERVLLKIRDDGADQVLPRLDSYAEIAAKAVG